MCADGSARRSRVIKFAAAAAANVGRRACPKRFIWEISMTLQQLGIGETILLRNAAGRERAQRDDSLSSSSLSLSSFSAARKRLESRLPSRRDFRAEFHGAGEGDADAD